MRHLFQNMAFGILTILLMGATFSASAQNAPQVNDAEIASIAVVANDIDINYGRLALMISSNDEVKNFANTMINDHTNVIAQAVDLATKLGVTPQDNDISQQLVLDAYKTHMELAQKTGSDFDKAYVNNEVAYHEAVIGAVKTLLIPQSSNKELKGLLEAVLPALEAHLEHAKMLQKSI